ALRVDGRSTLRTRRIHRGSAAAPAPRDRALLRDVQASRGQAGHRRGLARPSRCTWSASGRPEARGRPAGSTVTLLEGPPKIVFFDVGDTLVRIDPSWSAIYLRCCREFGLAVDETALRKAVDDASAAGFWDSSGPFAATEEASYRRIKAFDERIMANLGPADLPDRFYR